VPEPTVAEKEFWDTWGVDPRRKGNQRAVVVATVAVALIAVAVSAVQVLLFRYEYVHLVGTKFVKIDRLTGRTCLVTDDPFYAHNPCDPPTAEQERDFAISLARNTPIASSVTNTAGDYTWQAQDAMSAVESANPDNDKLLDSLDGSGVLDNALLVCYCNPGGKGLRWEVHIATRQALLVSFDAALSKRYGVHATQNINLLDSISLPPATPR
jgi:hypothetical protein